jgi:hypothetical protein
MSFRGIGPSRCSVPVPPRADKAKCLSDTINLASSEACETHRVDAEHTAQ